MEQSNQIKTGKPKFAKVTFTFRRSTLALLIFTFKEVELNKNNFEDFSKPFLLVKDTSKNSFKKNYKRKI